MEHLYVTKAVDGQELAHSSPDANPVDTAFKYLNYFSTVSAKIKPRDVVR